MRTIIYSLVILLLTPLVFATTSFDLPACTGNVLVRASPGGNVSGPSCQDAHDGLLNCRCERGTLELNTEDHSQSYDIVFQYNETYDGVNDTRIERVQDYEFDADEENNDLLFWFVLIGFFTAIIFMMVFGVFAL